MFEIRQLSKKIFCIYISFFSVIYSLLLCSKTYALPGSEDSNDKMVPINLSESERDIGPVLHAWCWKFNDVKENINRIAYAGYKSIQVSPVQKEKPAEEDGEDGSKDLSTWWTLYQPLNFKVGNCLGTEEEFKNMCVAAHKVGLKIIVDVVMNHLAQGDRSDEKYSKNIDEDLLRIGEKQLFHERGFEDGGFETRFDMTQKSLGGLPSLNTGNKDVQNFIIGFLERLIDFGADGFRFDAAKHIELPGESEGGLEFGSDFWPKVIGAITRKKSDIYVYGETLNDGITNFNGYIKYMNVTDSEIGNSIVRAVTEHKVNDIKVYHSPQDYDPGNFVTWVESHDTYASLESANLSRSDIILGWAMVASRRGAVPLYFARPNSNKDYQNNARDMLKGIKMGGCGDGLWKDKTISEINKFRLMAGNKEEFIIRNFDKGLVAVVRRNVGIVIANLKDSDQDVDFTLNLGREGNSFEFPQNNYTDIISRAIFGVDQDKHLRGRIQGRSVAVIYCCNTPDVAMTRSSSNGGLKFRLSVTNQEVAQYKVDNRDWKDYSNGDTVDVSDIVANGGDSVLISLRVNGNDIIKFIIRNYLIPVPRVHYRFRVELYESGWGKPHVYFYYDDPTSDSGLIIPEDMSLEWPGRKMDYSNEDSCFYYEMIIPYSTPIRVLVSDNGGDQIPGRLAPGIELEANKKIKIFGNGSSNRYELNDL